MQAHAHHHYFDYGYKEWQCIECDSGTDQCESDALKVDNTVGCIGSNRWPMGLPGTHPEFIKWAEEQGL